MYWKLEWNHDPFLSTCLAEGRESVEDGTQAGMPVTVEWLWKCIVCTDRSQDVVNIKETAGIRHLRYFSRRFYHDAYGGIVTLHTLADNQRDEQHDNLRRCDYLLTTRPRIITEEKAWWFSRMAQWSSSEWLGYPHYSRLPNDDARTGPEAKSWKCFMMLMGLYSLRSASAVWIYAIELCINNTYLHRHDNAPAHRSLLVQNKLATNNTNILHTP